LNKSVALFSIGHCRRFVLLAFMPQITLRRTLLYLRIGRKRTPVRTLPPRNGKGKSVRLYLTWRKYCLEESYKQHFECDASCSEPGLDIKKGLLKSALTGI